MVHCVVLIRQVAAMCSPSSTSKLASAPSGTAPCCVPLSILNVRHILGRPIFHLKIALSRVGIRTTSNTCFLGAHLSPCPKWHLDWFSRFCTAHGRESIYFIINHPFSVSQLPLHMRNLDSHLSHCFLGPPESNGISIGSAFFAWFTIVTDQLTDRPRYSIWNSRPHLRNDAF